MQVWAKNVPSPPLPFFPHFLDSCTQDIRWDWVCGRVNKGVGAAHLWSQKGVLAPLPIATLMPSQSTRALLVIPPQIFDMPGLGMNMSISERPLQYLQRRTLAQREFGSVSMRQPNLVRKASLTYLDERSPMPPLLMGRCTVSHERRCTVLFSSVPDPHTNRRILLSISPQTVRGSFTDCIEQQLIVERVDLVNVILPTNERYFDFQLVNLRSIFSQR